MKIGSEHTHKHDALYERLDLLFTAAQASLGFLPTQIKTEALVFLFRYAMPIIDPSALHVPKAIKNSIVVIDINHMAAGNHSFLQKKQFSTFDFDIEIAKVIPEYFKKNASDTTNAKKSLAYACAKKFEQIDIELPSEQRTASSVSKIFAQSILNNFPDKMFEHRHDLVGLWTVSNEVKYNYFKLLYAFRNKAYTSLTQKTKSIIETLPPHAQLLVQLGNSEFDYISLMHPRGLELLDGDPITRPIVEISGDLIELEKQCINEFGLLLIFEHKQYTPERILKRILADQFSFFEVKLPPFPWITPFHETETRDYIEYTTTKIDDSRLDYFKNNIFRNNITIDDKWIAKFGTLLYNYLYAKDSTAENVAQFKKHLTSFAEAQKELAKQMRSPVIGDIRGDTINRIAGLVLYDLKQELWNQGKTYGNEKIVDIFYDRYKQDFIDAVYTPKPAFYDRDHLMRHLRHAERCVENCAVLPLSGVTN